jgi:hypothetical protein
LDEGRDPTEGAGYVANPKLRPAVALQGVLGAVRLLAVALGKATQMVSPTLSRTFLTAVFLLTGWLNSAGEETMSPQRIEELIKMLMDDDMTRRRRASDELEQTGRKDPAVRRRLIEALRHNNRLVRLYAANALGRIGPNAKEAIPELERMLKNPKEQEGERSSAANALGLIGTASIPVLTRALKDDDVAVRQFAADIFVRLAPESTELIPTLIDTSR